MSREEVEVAVLAQIPMLTADVQRAYRLEKLGFSPSLSENENRALANDVIEDLSKNYSNVDFFDMSGSRIFSNVPFYKDELIYRDGHHLNEAGSYLYGNVATPYLASWVNEIKVK